MTKYLLDTVSMSSAYAQIHQQMVDEGKNTFVITADFTYGMGLLDFAATNPDRFMNMGIAEQNMASFAAGLATEGYIPFVHCFGVFASRRMLDQLYISCAYAGLNVKAVGADPGYTSGHNGGTHMSMEDIAIFRSIPKTLIVEPADAAALRKLVPQIADYNGFSYLRFFRGKSRSVYSDDAVLELGRASILREGRHVSLICCGQCVADALEASDMLALEGIEARVIDMFTIKPLDEDAVRSASEETELIVTVENGIAAGGLGGAVCELLASGRHAPVVRMGRGERFGEVGTVEDLKALYRLRACDIADTVRKALYEKRRER